MKEYTLNPTELQHSAIDKNDPAQQHTAVEYEFPPEFSPRAKMALDYFEAGSEHSAAFLFAYNGKLIVTDESLWLTAHGNGTSGSPLGFPRMECNTLAAVEEWLEQIADELDEDDAWE